MIKNLSELQSNAKHSYFAKRLTEALCTNNIAPTPIAFVSAYNKVHTDNQLKAHTVRKWLLGITKPRHDSMMLLAEWLKVSPYDFHSKPKVIKKIEIDFTDQEVISKYLSMNLKQKAAVSLLIDAILEKSR